MAAINSTFPWLSYYLHYSFFENKMNGHSAIASMAKKTTGNYLIALDDGTKLSVFICECYIFGVAEYIEVVQNLGPVDAVIINSNWCSYTLEAKKHCREAQVGVFTIGDFMSALNKRADFFEHLNSDEREAFRKNGWAE